MRRRKPTQAKKKATPAPKGSRKPGRVEGTVMYSTEDIIAALEEHHGLIYLAAKSLGCTPQTIYNRMEAEETIRDCVKAERGLFVDKAEDKLYGKVEAGNLDATKFVLKTLGRHRDFVERVETRLGGDSSAPPIKSESTPAITLEELPLEVKKAILDAIRQKKLAAEANNE